ncbi:LLM class flavin-dependent oxidoreductase [Halovivax cerinus]|uniref:LLM class flavin-dependent oxidoreductase n=1 Tax=Halovivax cerinus TaxID=1487865 RepID=A0ABD5NQ18_9EURY|nr:LLM class flavin-dependent oxidoreductase [Halovivax cerinus]
MVTVSAALLNEADRDELVSTVQTLEADTHYENVFISDERFYRNTYAQLALAGEHTDSVGLATGVTNPYTRNPAFTAAAIATIDELSDGRAFLGLGAGSPMALDPIGIDQEHAIETVRTAVDVIRRLQDGESVTTECEAFELHDVSLDVAPDRTVPIYVAGRGPQILSLGGHVGDGVIAGAGLTSVAGMEYAMERIEIGAAHGSRSVDDLDVVCWAFLSIATDRDAALDAVAPLVARIVQAVPTGTLESIGVEPDDAEAIKSLGDVDDVSPSTLRDTVSRDIVEQFSIAGTPDQCRAHVERLVDAGVDHIAVLSFANEENDTGENLRQFSDDVVEVCA